LVEFYRSWEQSIIPAFTDNAVDGAVLLTLTEEYLIFRKEYLPKVENVGKRISTTSFGGTQSPTDHLRTTATSSSASTNTIDTGSNTTDSIRSEYINRYN
jgi:hypothetical protein